MSRESSRPDPMDLSAYLDGEVSAEERRTIEEALLHDPELAAEFAEMQETARTIRSLSTLRAPDRIMSAVRQEIAPTPPSLSQSLGRSFGSWAALFVLAGLGIWFAVQDPAVRNPHLALKSEEDSLDRKGGLSSPKAPIPKIDKPATLDGADSAAPSASPKTETWDDQREFAATSEEPRAAKVGTKGKGRLGDEPEGAVVLSEDAAPERSRGSRGSPGRPKSNVGDIEKTERQGLVAGSDGESGITAKRDASSSLRSRQTIPGTSDSAPSQTRAARSRSAPAPASEATTASIDPLAGLEAIVERIFEAAPQPFTTDVEGSFEELAKKRAPAEEVEASDPLVLRVSLPAEVTAEQIAELALSLRGDEERSGPLARRSAKGKKDDRAARREAGRFQGWILENRSEWQQSLPFAGDRAGAMAWTGTLEGLELLSAVQTVRAWRTGLDGEAPRRAPFRESDLAGLFGGVGDAVRFEGDPQSIVRWFSQQLAAGGSEPSSDAEVDADQADLVAPVPPPPVRLRIVFERSDATPSPEGEPR